MGLTKQYRRFSAGPVFGVVGSAKCSPRTLPGQSDLVLAAKADKLVVWNLRTGEKVLETREEDVKNEITALEVAYDGEKALAAAGYHDGAVRLYSLESGQCEVTLNGHKSAVTCLAFDKLGLRLASGSRDSAVVVWDVVNEAGLFRLRGHKGPVTQCLFMKGRNALVTCSKDTTVKFWDLDIQHCFHTLASHVTEVWAAALVKDERYLVTGAGDSELRVFRLTFRENDEEGKSTLEPFLKKLRVDDEDVEDDDDENEAANPLIVEKVGSILRAGQDKVASLRTDAGGRVMCCHGSDANVELILICTDEEAKKRCQKRARKERRKVASTGQTAESEGPAPEPTIGEEFRRLKVLKAGGKVRGLDVQVARHGVEDTAMLTVLLAGNAIERHRAPLGDRGAEASLISRLDRPGHRTDVRSLNFTSDNTAILSASGDSAKLWARSSTTCLRTVPTAYALSSLVVPGDRQAVVGAKSGALQIVDLASAEVVEDVVEAHAKEVWDLSMAADNKGFASASADKTVKFWDFELLRFDDDVRKLSVVHNRTLKLDEEALAVKLSADGRLVAVSLMDSTVKVFFVDSLKFFLSLYGHKLPALAVDISTDSALIVTGGADKNVKIWGLDFGDCHKSIFAHDDGVVAVKFIPNTHMFFSAGKDGKVKQWDADNFERVLTLDGHHGEIRAMAVSPNGKYVATAGHDKTLRLWERTEEVLVLEDERETEREKEGDEELATGEARPLTGEQDKEAGLAGKKTAESEKGAERLMEALQLYHDHRREIKECEEAGETAPQLPPLMLAYRAYTPDDYMVKMAESVKSGEIEQTLLVLPLDSVVQLLEALEILLAARTATAETLCRMFFFALEIHFGALSASQHLHPLITRVKALAEARLRELKDALGFNLAVLDFCLERKSERERALALEDAVLKVREKRRKNRNKEKALHAAVMAL